MKAIEAAGGATPQELTAAGEAGSNSSNPDISQKARLLAAYSAAAMTAIQAGGDQSQYTQQLGGMVQELLAACQENGYK